MSSPKFRLPIANPLNIVDWVFMMIYIQGKCSVCAAVTQDLIEDPKFGKFFGVFIMGL